MTGLDLRPLSLGEILDRTFSLYRRHFLLFIGIAAIPHILTLAFGLMQIWVAPSPAVLGQRGGLPNFQALALTFGLTMVFLVLASFVYAWAQAGTVFAVSELYLGRQTSIAQALRSFWQRAGSFIGVLLLNGLATLGALLLLVIPGIYVACRLLVCMPAAVVERQGPSSSLSRSWALTRDYAGRAFVLCLLYFVLSIGLSLLLQTPLTIAASAARNDIAKLHLILALQQVLGTAANILVTPFVLIGTSVFYFDLRVRKEAFDLQFMMDPASERIAGNPGSSATFLS